MHRPLATLVVFASSLTACAAPPERTLTFDPVELVAGREVPGSPSISLEHESYTYHFATPEHRAAFERDPAAFEVADGGACGSMGPLSGLGDARRFSVHEGRIYLFASDGCRETFRKDPAQCIERDDPVPSGDEAAKKSGLAIVDRAIAWAGGAERIAALRTYRQEIAKPSKSNDGQGDWLERQVVSIEFPSSVAQLDAWSRGDVVHSWTTVATKDGAVAKSSKRSDALARVTKAAFLRQAARMPIVLLRARSEPGFVAVADGSGAIVDGNASVDVDFVQVGYAGATSRLAIERSTGRLVQQSFRGRDGTPFVGESVRRFTSYAVSKGVTIPSGWTTEFNGKPTPTRTVAVSSIAVDDAIPAEVFDVRLQ